MQALNRTNNGIETQIADCLQYSDLPLNRTNNGIETFDAGLYSMLYISVLIAPIMELKLLILNLPLFCPRSLNRTNNGIET